MNIKTIIVTGGAGFIGSNLILNWTQDPNVRLINIDKLTYAGNLENLRRVENNPRYTFIKGDILDRENVSSIISRYQPSSVVNLAAESHVDRSIGGPRDFIQTNIVGASVLLECVQNYWYTLPVDLKSNFRFLHVSTDEVYGSLGVGQPGFTENSNYRPNSPYSASKAASDHLVRAWHHTYGLPVITTNCSNNYGPFQFPEKLIPLMINNALLGKDLPIYGDGRQVRDWLYVEDHIKALKLVLEKGTPGETYNIGGENQVKNIDLVNMICSVLDKFKPIKNGVSYNSQIRHVTDRPGHDRRYAVDISKIRRELGWEPNEKLEMGIVKTINWYLENLERFHSVSAH